jgi:site-specific DNA recombinase
LAQAERKLQGLYDAIAEGLRTAGLLGQLQELEAERDRLAASVAEAAPTPVRLHPNLPQLYRKEVARLRDALADPLTRDEAVDQLRRLMTKVTVRAG